MRVAVFTQDFVAVAFQVPIAGVSHGRELNAATKPAETGPDVLGPEFDDASAVAAAAGRVLNLRPAWRC